VYYKIWNDFVNNRTPLFPKSLNFEKHCYSEQGMNNDINGTDLVSDLEQDVRHLEEK